jgi:hypothetical protein
MSERIKCPVCSAGLILPESVRGSPATCPRCLAEISTPVSGREANAIQTERPEWGKESSWCPHCGRTVEAIWITCPWCEEPLRGRDLGRRGRADLDVRRDMKGTSCFVIVLAVIGGIGVTWCGLQAFSVAAQGGYSALLYLVVPLLFLAGVSTLIVFVRSGGNPGASGVRRVIVGTLAMAGGLVLLSALTVFAFFVYILIVCGGLLRPH